MPNMLRSWHMGAACTLAAATAVYWLYRKLNRPRVTLEPSAAAASAAPPPSKVQQPSMAASAAAPSNSTDAAPFPLGTTVKLTGLQSKPELNGQRGRVIGWDAAKGRLNVALVHGSTKMIQVKPPNVLVMDPSDLRIEDMNSDDLVKLTLRSHTSLTPAHAQRLIELLRTASDPLEGGNVLRCCCACEWLVAALKDPTSGETKVGPLMHAALGLGLRLSPRIAC